MKNIGLILTLHFFSNCLAQQNLKITDLRDSFVGLYKTINPPYSSYPYVYHILVQKITTSSDSLIIHDSLWATSPTTGCPVNCYQHRVKLNADSSWIQYSQYYGNFKKVDTIYLHFLMPGFPPVVFDYYAKRVITLGVDELNNGKDCIIYPNPSSYKIIVAIKGNINVEKLILFNIEGKEVFVSNTNVKEIDVSKLSDGLYFLEVSTSDGVLVEKVIVQH